MLVQQRFNGRNEVSEAVYRVQSLEDNGTRGATRIVRLHPAIEKADEAGDDDQFGRFV
ncbi:MAG: hypothetical protein SFY80_15860 [Verrucomicrobiota bacterium]|nr:hypothetical protein [Verrucomicrobiota bacterium]